MGIDSESDREATLRIGPTSLGMVRVYVESGSLELPMDFDPDEADEIAEELRSAATRARRISPGKETKVGSGRRSGGDRR